MLEKSVNICILAFVVDGLRERVDGRIRYATYRTPQRVEVSNQSQTEINLRSLENGIIVQFRFY